LIKKNELILVLKNRQKAVNDDDGFFNVIPENKLI